MNTGEWWAHEGEPLVDHLRSVAALARRFAPPWLDGPAEVAGLVHDLAKATPQFQARLRGERHGGAEANHAYLGALFGAWVARQQGWDALAVFLAVARHHGRLRTPGELLPHPADIDPPEFLEVDRPGLRQALRALATQLTAVRASWPVLCRTLGLPDPQPFLEGEVWETLRELAEEALDLGYLEAFEASDQSARQRYWDTNLLFSALIDADKKLAAGYRPSERLPLPPDLVDAYRSTFDTSSSPLAPFRRMLYDTVDTAIREHPLDKLYPAVLTLTAPTGSGKTLAVLNAALKLRARLGRERGISPRIVYALPFVNLIEQTSEIVRDVLRKGGVDPAEVVVEHHHLAPIAPGGTRPQAAATTLFADDAVDVDERLLLAESWDAEIVLTTFVQVFHTLVGYENRMLKKLHTLAEGAILILDEVQALDARYWPLVRQVLADLPRLGVTVILMTATQPALTLPGTALELAPAFPSYPTRVVIRPSTPRTIDELAEEIASQTAESQVVVVNSVRVSIELFQALVRRGVSHLVYLSTNVTPYDRAQRLQTLRCQLKTGIPVVLVSTQVIEAGVDLDFGTGWRELGPFESLVQVAGRVNRHAGGERMGELRVVELAEGQGHLVYGRVLLDAARALLQRPLTDREVDGLLTDYFATIEERIAQERAWRLLAALPRLDYDRDGVDCRRGGASLPVRCFQLIDEPPTLSIFVEQNDEASQVLRDFRAAHAIDDPVQRRLALRRLRPAVEQYTITPLLRRAVGNLPRPLFATREDMRLIRREELDSFYDAQTGFKWDIEQFL